MGRSFTPEEKNEIRKALRVNHELVSGFEINYVLSHKDTMACFEGKKAYLTDLHYSPIYSYESTSYINACCVSDNSIYMLIQTAHNPQNDEDSGATIIIDLTTEEIISKAPIITGWKGVTRIFIDEKTETFWLYYKNERIQYDFSCNPMLKPGETIARLLYRFEMRNTPPNPYTLETIAYKILKEANGNIDSLSQEILLNIIDEVEKRLSPSRMAKLYSAIADVYFIMSKQGIAGAREKAKLLYEEGLFIYPKLPVKKKLEALK